MRKLYILFIPVIFLSNALRAQTWSDDVASIIYNNCSSCHRPGGIGPMSLMSYDEAYASRFSIKAAVQSRHMPPWPPDPSYTKFTDQRVLSAGQISAIVNWVNNGATRGNIANEPQPPSSLSNNLGSPNMSLKMPDYTSTATNKDVYICFVLPPNLSEDKVLSAVEVIPGNASIVHHVLVYQDTTKEKKARQQSPLHRLSRKVSPQRYTKQRSPSILPIGPFPKVLIMLKITSLFTYLIKNLGHF